MQIITDLQFLVNKRAESKLDADLEVIYGFVCNNPILSRTDSDLPEVYYKPEGAPDQYKATKPVWFFKPTSNYMTKLKQALLPEYIERESELFLQRVEELESGVQNLMNANQYE